LKLGFQKCLKWRQTEPLSPIPGNFGQFGPPRQFGLAAGQFYSINRAICTEENRFEVGIPKMLKMETDSLFPDLPVGDISVDLYYDWELQVMAMISESLGARMRAHSIRREEGLSGAKYETQSTVAVPFVII
jgi:hypothetical protein